MRMFNNLAYVALALVVLLPVVGAAQTPEGKNTTGTATCKCSCGNGSSFFTNFSIAAPNGDIKQCVGLNGSTCSSADGKQSGKVVGCDGSVVIGGVVVRGRPPVVTQPTVNQTLTPRAQ